MHATEQYNYTTPITQSILGKQLDIYGGIGLIIINIYHTCMYTHTMYTVTVVIHSCIIDI